ncbi:MAG TPA: family 1 glycosylhydrolase [Puia sp.]|nr:family 1 glycosylhydrolase [Puia sp.]
MDVHKTFDRPELWGGIECTINRIGDEYKDQLRYSGHYERSGDMEAIADLGIKTIRYPVLWEKHQPDKNRKIDWQWTDRQLSRIRTLGMTPIAGLLHHGSGPAFTNLSDPDFPYLLASYAYEVASRYPWIKYYTPVNEPLTTARFSGLYGLWYPHHKTEVSFYRMLLNQLKGTVLCMKAIRSVNPSAQLIQTEDLGKSHSTPLLAYQAEFENERRLLTFDILTGRLVPGHPHYNYMIGCGIREEEIHFFQEQTCELHILGLNYYVTSERWLDESLEKYPHQTHGGNGSHRYADTEVVRANPMAFAGFKTLATEIWERYDVPMAVTECHLHCTREEQLRWFKEIRDAAAELTEQGIKIKGVTAWALLGSFDWDTLLTKTGTQYESGVFDIKTFPGRLRPTALVHLLKYLATGKGSIHPVLAENGWWHARPRLNKIGSQPIIITGNMIGEEEEKSSKNLFNVLQEACRQRRIPCIFINTFDENEIDKINPWAVINTGSCDQNIRSLCLRKKLRYVSCCNEDPDIQCLKIIIEQMPVTIHQVNKILDLMIDGDDGRWYFSADGMIFKSQDLSGKHHKV